MSDEYTADAYRVYPRFAATVAPRSLTRTSMGCSRLESSWARNSAAAVPSYRTAGLTLLAWLAFNVFWPQDWGIDARVRFAMLLVPFVAILAVTLCGFLVPLPFRTRSRVEAVPSTA